MAQNQFIGIKNNNDINELEKLSPDVFVDGQNASADFFNSSYALLQASAEKYPNHKALSMLMQAKPPFKLTSINYQQLFAKVTQTANFFSHLGASKDDVIALVMPNFIQTHLAIWGAQAAGIVMPINALLEPQAISELLREVDAKIVVTVAPFPKIDIWQNVVSAAAEVPSLKYIVTVNLAAQLTGLTSMVAKVLQKKHQKKLYGNESLSSVTGLQVLDFDQEIEKQPADQLISGRQIHLDDKASFFCTSGTTGMPKIAMRSHKTELANVRQVLAHLGENTIDSSKTVLTGLPLFHVNPVIATGLFPFMQGAHVILATPAGFRGDNVISGFWQLVQKHQINFFSAVPTVYSALLNHPIGEHDISSLQYGVCGAAPMPVQVFKDFEQATGVKILEGYGLTEGACVSSINPVGGERKIGSIGLRLPMQQMQVVDATSLAENGRFRICDANETGVLMLSGDNLFVGYKIAAQNEGMWLNDNHGKRWLNTGDIGYQDDEGYFYLTGRKKEMIIRGGHNINPKSIEEVLYSHADVAFAAAIGKPDAYAGELPIVYVELKAGSKADEAQLKMFCETHIQERAAIPKEIHIIENMPVTTVGKVYKPDLQKMAIDDCFKAALQAASIDAEIVTTMHRVYGLETTVNVMQKAQIDACKKVLGVYAVRHIVQ